MANETVEQTLLNRGNPHGRFKDNADITMAFWAIVERSSNYATFVERDIHERAG